MYQTLLAKPDLIRSMSGKGYCYESAVAESFFHTLKVEAVHGESLANREHMRRAVFEYIEVATTEPGGTVPMSILARWHMNTKWPLNSLSIVYGQDQMAGQPNEVLHKFISGKYSTELFKENFLDIPVRSVKLAIYVSSIY
jgi:hypothetical protein